MLALGVVWDNGGAEATENAVRMSRLHTGRNKVLNHYRSYHGATNGAITLTGDPRRWPSEPGMSGIVHFWGPYPYRSAFSATTEAQEDLRKAAQPFDLGAQHEHGQALQSGGQQVTAANQQNVCGAAFESNKAGLHAPLG